MNPNLTNKKSTLNDVLINIKNVYCINLLKEKQVLNMSYAKQSTSNMSGFFFKDIGDNEWYINSEYFKKNFYEVQGIDRTLLINLEKLAYVKKDYSNSTKLIFVFSHSYERTDGELAPEYMYLKVEDSEIDEIYEQLKQVIRSYLG